MLKNLHREFSVVYKLLMNEWTKINVFKHQSKMLIVVPVSRPPIFPPLYRLTQSDNQNFCERNKISFLAIKDQTENRKKIVYTRSHEQPRLQIEVSVLHFDEFFFVPFNVSVLR